MNNLLKLALIISIFFSVANSVSALSEDSSQQNAVDNQKKGSSVQSTQQEKNDNSKSRDKQLKQNQQDKNNPKAKIKNESQNNQPSKEEEILQPPNSVKISNQKTLTITDLLLYIDLPVLATLLLLWFFSQKKQQQQIDKIKSSQNKIISKFNQLNELDNKLNNLDKTNYQIIEAIKVSNQKNIDSEVRLHELISKQQFNQSTNYHNSSTSDTLHLNTIAIVDKISRFVENYNQNKNLSLDRVIATVKPTQENVEQRRSGNIDKVALENTAQKKYWIIEEDNEHYLIPHAKINIEEHNRTTLESLFDCTNFTSEYSDFQLIKPAKVAKLSSEIWQLEEKGKLNFD